MVRLYPIRDFLPLDTPQDLGNPSYWYEGRCPDTQVLLRLPRTPLLEAIAHHFLCHLPTLEGKMYGLLLVETPTGERGILKAYSGQIAELENASDWVPSIPRREQIHLLETQILEQLARIKNELITLASRSEKITYTQLEKGWKEKLKTLQDRHKNNKKLRQELREKLSSENSLYLDEESRKEKREIRILKQERDAILKPLQEIIIQIEQRQLELKQLRKNLSRQLQEQMYEAYSLTNFSGKSLTLKHFMNSNLLPTGTGECCAPKLLHYAATHNLKPLALAEFWGGRNEGEKIVGEFYGACQERCQPLMGFLLGGLPALPKPEIIYEDEYILVINKPAGLLSVPGRTTEKQDSIVSRLHYYYTADIRAVHRLDLETSGLLICARDLDTYRYLSQQFQQRQVNKIYEALVSGIVEAEEGIINLPLWGDPEKRPYQEVDWQRGKESITEFRVLKRYDNNLTRVEFRPKTGRTHQIRVHAASPYGLKTPILGDRLYNHNTITTESRLNLHAREIEFTHPHQTHKYHFQIETPF
jgi:tRNA pseudouridine32 synthase/23S rRNA pseudouridine746 synthase